VQYLPVRGRQLAHRVRHRDAQHGGRRVVFHRQIADRALAGFRGPRAFPAMLVDDDPPGHRRQPGHQGRAGPVEPAGLPPGADHGLLHDIFGLLPVPVGQAQHESHQRRPVCLVERRDNGVVFPACDPHRSRAGSPAQKTHDVI
jgi:hypothetical protein